MGLKTLENACLQLLQSWTHSPREAAAVLGLIASSFLGVVYGPLHYRTLEMEKFLALKVNKGNFDGSMVISSETISDIDLTE